jgi:3-dehydroquinate dehydratase/shikimate dehydrogenase
MIKIARAKGMHVVQGSEMFVQQGARQFETWSGKPAPLMDMQRVVDFALAQRAAATQESNGTRKKKK